MPNFSKDSGSEHTQEDVQAEEATFDKQAQDAAVKEAADKAHAEEAAKQAEIEAQAVEAAQGADTSDEDAPCEATVAVVLDPEFVESVAQADENGDVYAPEVAYVSTALDDEVALSAEPTYLCPENAELVLASAAGKLYEEE